MINDKILTTSAFSLWLLFTVRTAYQKDSTFLARWMLIATWYEVPAFGTGLGIGFGSNEVTTWMHNINLNLMYLQPMWAKNESVIRPAQLWVTICVALPHHNLQGHKIEMPCPLIGNHPKYTSISLFSVTYHQYQNLNEFMKDLIEFHSIFLIFT